MASHRIGARSVLVVCGGVWLVGIPAGLAGCSGTQPGDICDGAAEVGTGTTAFEPLIERPALQVITGPQGGHHFILNARMIGLVPGDPSTPGAAVNPTTRFAVYRGGVEIQIAQPDLEVGYRDAADGFEALPSGRIVQLEELALEGLDGQPVSVAVQITDSRGECARDDAEVVAAVPLPPSDPPAPWPPTLTEAAVERRVD